MFAGLWVLFWFLFFFILVTILSFLVVVVVDEDGGFPGGFAVVCLDRFEEGGGYHVEGEIGQGDVLGGKERR